MYIAIFLLILLVIISGCMILWSLMNSERVYQFPMFAGGAWLFFVVPQVVGLINNPSAIPLTVHRENGLELAILMSCLCALASFLGYLKKSKKALLRKKVDVLSIGRVFISGMVLAVVSYYGFIQIILLSGGFESYINGGNYSLEWRGMPVVYAFFMALIWPSLMLCLMATLKRPSIFRWLVVLCVSIQPVISIILLGRRSSFVIFLLIIGISLYFIRRWTPPKSYAILAMLFALTFVLVAPEFRGEKSIDTKIEKIKNISITEQYETLFSGEEYLEFMVPVVVIPTLNNTMEFGYGRGIYNAMVHNWVPTVITGREFKRALFMPTVDINSKMHSEFGWSIPYGSNPTGVADVFVEFWFLGLMLFYFLGRFFRAIWDRAVLCGSFSSMMFYVALIPLSMETVYGTFNNLPSRIVYLVIFLFPLIMFCKMGKRHHSNWVMENINAAQLSNR